MNTSAYHTYLRTEALIQKKKSVELYFFASQIEEYMIWLKWFYSEKVFVLIRVW